MDVPWWAVPADDVVVACRSDAGRGLTAVAAARRLAQDGPNELEPEATVPRWRRLVAALTEPLVVLLLVAVAVALAVWWVEGRHGTPVDAVVILVIVAANAVLGVVQERRAEGAVAALARMSAASARVLRDGRPLTVPARDVVVGDVLLVAEGDRVAADARLLAAAALEVSEASLTGESLPTAKDPAPVEPTTPLAERSCVLLGGTDVVRGTGRAVVVATGTATETGRVAQLLESTPADPTPLQREMALVGRSIGLAVAVIAVVVVVTVALTSELRGPSDLVTVLLLGVSLAVAAVPEGLPAVLSVVLALGVQRMARRNAIVTRLSSVETLGSASVICTDKTGTLTAAEMTVRAVVTASGELEVDGPGYGPHAQVRVLRDDGPAGALAAEVAATLGGAALASDATVRDGGGVRDGGAVPDGGGVRDGGGAAADRWVPVGDPTEAALVAAALRTGTTPQGWTRLAEAPFTSERKRMSVVVVRTVDGGDPGGPAGPTGVPGGPPDSSERLVLVCKGAPDVLLARCTAVAVADGCAPLDGAARHAVEREVLRLSGLALRTIAVARREVARPAAGALDAAAVADLEQGLTWCGVVGLYDPPRPQAAAAVADAQRAGIRVVMITGDHPTTGRRIAADVGIAATGVLTGADLDGLDDDALRAALAETGTVARVSPEHKLRIVDALQAGGEVVAMTGDGVNDAPALRSADIGVAMGRTGTEVTRRAAAMVLADDDVATIVAAVAEGRAIGANIRTFLRYLLSSNIGEVLTVLGGVLLAGVLGLTGHGEAVVVPLLATQILWVNLLTDAAPALALGVDRPVDDVMAAPPRARGARVIDAAMWRGVAVVGVVTAAAVLVTIDLYLPGGLLTLPGVGGGLPGGGGDLTKARTAGFTVLVLAQLVNAFAARSQVTSARVGLLTNRWLWAAVTLSAALQVAVVHVPVLQRAFGTAPLDLGQWLVCAAMASSVLWATELAKALAGRHPR